MSSKLPDPHGRGTGAEQAWVPILRADAADPELFEELMTAVREVASRNAFNGGRYLVAFERDLAAACEIQHACGVASGTAALTIALKALGIGRGDRVVVPANSHIGTAEAVCHAGADVRLADVDRATGLLTAATTARALTAGVRAVIPVHLGGATADIDAVAEVAHAVGAVVVEDAGQAAGARLRGRPVGTIGDAGALSFDPAKGLGAWGDAGAVLTADADVAERVALLRSHGSRRMHIHRVVGDSASLDALHAAVLRAKLPRLELWNAERRTLAARLRAGLAGVPGLELPPAEPVPGGDHVHHAFVVRSEHRDALRRHLDAARVETDIHYPVPIHLTGAFASLGLGQGAMPVAERLAWHSLTLPLPRGMTDAALGVDTQNASGALRVYERCGFRVASKSTEYRRRLD